MRNSTCDQLPHPFRSHPGEVQTPNVAVQLTVETSRAEICVKSCGSSVCVCVCVEGVESSAQCRRGIRTLPFLACFFFLCCVETHSPWPRDLLLQVLSC